MMMMVMMTIHRVINNLVLVVVVVVVVVVVAAAAAVVVLCSLITNSFLLAVLVARELLRALLDVGHRLLEGLCHSFFLRPPPPQPSSWQLPVAFEATVSTAHRAACWPGMHHDPPPGHKEYMQG